ncbi:MAG: OmpL47-type beta-barrel domain-containing protein, partial [Candidatus Thorarchaeota archaeon]
PLLKTTWYTLDGGITNIIFSGLTGTFNQTEWDKRGDGTVTIRFSGNDTLGNEGYAEVTVRKDTIAPTSSISYIVHKEPNMVIKSTTFTLTADDGSGSGVSVIRYKIDDSEWFEYSAPFDLSQYIYGDILISYQAIDEIGNIEEKNTLLVELVDTGPSDNVIMIVIIAVSIAGVVGVGIAIFVLRKKKRAISGE